jgi:hypothetical protein
LSARAALPGCPQNKARILPQSIVREESKRKKKKKRKKKSGALMCKNNSSKALPRKAGPCPTTTTTTTAASLTVTDLHRFRNLTYTATSRVLSRKILTSRFLNI